MGCRGQGNVWAGDSIVSLSFSGDLNVLDPRSAEPSRIVYGRESQVWSPYFPPYWTDQLSADT